MLCGGYASWARDKGGAKSQGRQAPSQEHQRGAKGNIRTY
jgi:hypothetical protein